jgi:hypothetical protein
MFRKQAQTRSGTVADRTNRGKRVFDILTPESICWDIRGINSDRKGPGGKAGSMERADRADREIAKQGRAFR